MNASTSNVRVFLEELESRCHLSVTTLLQDDFNGAALDGAIWQQPLWNPNGSTFVGRTQFQVRGSSPAPTVTDGSLQPNLQSYNPTQLPGEPSFWGTEVLSNDAFSAAPGQTLDILFRAKLNMAQGGGVLGLFLYTVNSDGNHDESDIELESNQIADGSNQVETNIYADQPLGAGSPASFALPSGGALSGWHTYEMKLDAGVITNGVTVIAPSVSWYVDGKLIRSEGDIIPTHAMNVYINFWAPDQTWAQAYNAGIQPTSDPNQNQESTADIDSVLVTSSPDSLPVTVSSASIKIKRSDIAAGQTESAKGTVEGSGSGQISYRWLALAPDGTVLDASGALRATMTNGVAPIRRFSGLPSSEVGTHQAWIQVIRPGRRVNSPAQSYTVAGAAPGISITSVPKFGVGGDATGKVFNIDRADYQGVAVYIDVNGQWYSKPYYDATITPIASDYSWEADVDTGGDDIDFTQALVALIPDGVSAPVASGQSSLPSQLFSLVHVTITRSQ